MRCLLPYLRVLDEVFITWNRHKATVGLPTRSQGWLGDSESERQVNLLFDDDRKERLYPLFLCWWQKGKPKEMSCCHRVLVHYGNNHRLTNRVETVFLIQESERPGIATSTV